MHPEIVRSAPGSRPICGMALEPRTVTLEQEQNPELEDMQWRFWISLALSVLERSGESSRARSQAEHRPAESAADR